MARLHHSHLPNCHHGLVPARTARDVPPRTQRREGAILPPLRRRLPRVVRLPADCCPHLCPGVSTVALQNHAE